MHNTDTPFLNILHKYICRDCNSCMRDLTCGYCYLDTDHGPQNGTCLRANYDEPFKAVSGRCNDTHLPGDLTWAYDFCPTQFYWMPMIGLVAYLMFFAPGKCIYLLVLGLLLTKGLCRVVQSSKMTIQSLAFNEF